MSRYHDSPSIQIRFEWSPNAIRGFVVALIVLVVILLMSMCTSYSPPEPYSLPKTTPVTLMVLGEGDGTGARKGNLSREGASQRGQQALNPLEDARRSASSVGKNQATDPTQTAHLIAVKEVGRDGKPNNTDAADRTVGNKDGRDDGTGLGWVGSGPGKGLGYGDIDWGGGGNRTVVSKVLPKFPPGTLNTEVKLRFRVLSDGTVSLVWPVRRGGNPAVDQEAMRVLKQWRFNKLSTGLEMEGTITFVFKNT
ncbi:MAG: energy transducer TonB [Candidatus Kapabacteria bacterium]|nr:energy transducer TonB [Candidatus Kapabacteria bacterium]